MATTTNYGWTTPDDTALVKDGASAIRTLGSSVDTTTKNLNPETTLGDLSFRSSTSNVNTRIPIGSSGQHLTVVAGVPAWATASDQTPLTTKGDLLGFSTLDARIPIGANGTLLTADSTESLGLKWAAPAGGSGLTLIDEVAFTNAQTVNVNDVFSTTYRNYRIVMNSSGTPFGNDCGFKLRVSSTDTSADYTTRALQITGSVSSLLDSLGNDEIWLGSNGTTNQLSIFSYDITSPFTTTRTALIGANGYDNVSRWHWGFHNAATSFTGFSLLFTADTTGTVAIFGYAKE